MPNDRERIMGVRMMERWCSGDGMAKEWLHRAFLHWEGSGDRVFGHQVTAVKDVETRFVRRE